MSQIDGYHCTPSPTKAGRIQRELEGKRSKAGEPLTDVEAATVMSLAMVRADDFCLTTWARMQHIHVNTLKYRLACIGEKWGLEKPTCMEVTWMALGKGYGGQQATTDALMAFVLRLEHSLPSGPLTPLSDGLRKWLRNELGRFLRERNIGQDVAA